jgi:hypothetical protein
MKATVLVLLALFSSHVAAAEKRCAALEKELIREETAYKSVIRVGVAGHEAHNIIGRFIETGDTLLNECPNSFSLDRRYTLRRELNKARKLHERYEVMTIDQVRGYAIRNPERRVIYKWGTIRPVP